MSRNQKVELDQFDGINNVDDATRNIQYGSNLVLYGGGLKQNYQQGCVNFYQTNDKKLKQRSGYTRFYAHGVHSLWSDDYICLFREADKLQRLTNEFTVTTLQTGLIGQQRMAYLPLNDKVYYSDGINSGVFVDNRVRTWGLYVPQPPILRAVSGELKSGRYQVCITYLRDDGQESGASESSLITVGDNGGIHIEFTPSVDSSVVGTNVYLTTRDGSTFYYVTTLTRSEMEYTEDGNFDLSIPLATQFKKPPPAGTALEYYNSRLYIASYNNLYYSDPFSYELFNEEYLPFEKNITMLGAVADGLYLSTEDSIFFLSGDAAPLKRIKVFNYGAVLGAMTKVDGSLIGDGKSRGVVLLFMTDNGLCVAQAGGNVTNVTSKVFNFDDSDRGACHVVEPKGDARIVVTLQ